MFGVIGLAGLVAAASLGVACHVPNSTVCGRVGVAVWPLRAERAIEATIDGKSVRLQRNPAYWSGFVHLDLHRMGLPAMWDGDEPTRVLTVRLVIHDRSGRIRRGSIHVRLRPGWG